MFDESIKAELERFSVSHRDIMWVLIVEVFLLCGIRGGMGALESLLIKTRKFYEEIKKEEVLPEANFALAPRWASLTNNVTFQLHRKLFFFFLGDELTENFSKVF